MTDALFSTVQQAFTAHSLLIFRDQHEFGPADLVAFAQRFPHNPEVKSLLSPFALQVLPEHPLVMAQGNEPLRNHYGLTTDEHYGFPSKENGLEWHTDNIDAHVPSIVTSLHCLATPSNGGDTLFASGTALFAALSPAQQRHAEQLVVRYCKWQLAPGTQNCMRGDGLRLEETGRFM
jgi:alpha-ketoglutarate-dependent taurine dioxygenase